MSIQIIKHNIKLLSQNLLSDKHTHEVISVGFMASVLKLFGVFVAFLFNLVLANTLGASGIGKFFLVYLIINISTIVGKAGIDQSLLRFITPYAFTNNWGLVRDIHKKGLIIVISVSTIISILIYILAPSISERIFNRADLGTLLQAFSFAILPLALLYIYIEVFKAIKWIKMSISIKEILLPLIVVLLIFIKPGVESTSNIISFYTGTAISLCIFATIFWLTFTNRKSGHKSNEKFAYRQLLDSSRPLYLLSLFQLVITWCPVFVLGVYMSDEAVGLFEIANRIAALSSFFLIAFNTILAPKIGELYIKNDLKTIEKLCQNTTLVITVLAAPVLLTFAIFPKFVLGLFGSDFTQASILLKILIVGQFVNVIFGPVGFLLIMCGKEYLIRNAIVYSALFMVGCSIILIPFIGIVGAAIASSLTLIIKNLIAAFYVRREFGIVTLPIYTFNLKNK